MFVPVFWLVVFLKNLGSFWELIFARNLHLAEGYFCKLFNFKLFKRIYFRVCAIFFFSCFFLLLVFFFLPLFFSVGKRNWSCFKMSYWAAAWKMKFWNSENLKFCMDHRSFWRQAKFRNSTGIYFCHSAKF